MNYFTTVYPPPSSAPLVLILDLSPAVVHLISMTTRPTQASRCTRVVQ